MTPQRLHGLLKQSLTDAVTRKRTRALQLLLESTSSERLLTDFLFLTLVSEGHEVSREKPLGLRRTADLVLHERKAPVFIEMKQLHLDDGCKYAPPNLSRDLARHVGNPDPRGALHSRRATKRVAAALRTIRRPEPTREARHR